MQINIIGEQSNAIFDPLRVWRGIGSDKNLGENISGGVGGLIDFAIETPFSLLENLFFRVPARIINKDLVNKKHIFGHLDIPDKFETENLFSKISNIDLKKHQTSILRQNFIDQYTDKYNLHRLDFNFTPRFNDAYHGYRFMDMEIDFLISDSIRTTDVYPQTKWEKEGLQVSDYVYLNAKGKYTTSAKIQSSLPIPVPGLDVNVKPIEGDAEITKGRNYFYSIKYETEVPVIEGRSLSNGFGWRLRGTYERFIDCGTKQLTAVLLVPNNIQEATIQLKIKCGVTNKDRRDPGYPQERTLEYGVASTETLPLFFGS